MSQRALTLLEDLHEKGNEADSVETHLENLEEDKRGSELFNLKDTAIL